MRFCEPDDLLVYEPSLATDVPKDRWSWDNAIDLGMDEIDRRLRGRKDTAEPVELGRLGIRTKQRLKASCAAFALHYLYEQVNTHGDGGDAKFARKAHLHLERADSWLENELQYMDYDIDNSGTVDDIEKNQPSPCRVIRG